MRFIKNIYPCKSKDVVGTSSRKRTHEVATKFDLVEEELSSNLVEEESRQSERAKKAKTFGL